VWARRPEAAEEAVRRGAADEATTDLAQAVAGADLVVLATPIGAMAGLAAQIRPHLSAGCLVTDVGSVKYPVVRAVSHALAGRARFVGSHPMAGSEQSGIDQARPDLFWEAVCIVTPAEDTDAAAVQQVHDFWRSVGAVVRTMGPQIHDEVVARVSHLPHLAAAALVNAVTQRGPDLLGCAGPGLRDSTRVASGPPEMWVEICQENRQEIRRALDDLIGELEQIRAALENDDGVALRQFLERAKHFRDELKFRS